MSTIELARRALRDSALLEPERDLGALAVRGEDRQTWLNGLVTCELAKLGPGAGAYGLAVAKNGKILAELSIGLGEEEALVGLPRALAPGIAEHFERHLIMEDAEIEDASAELSLRLLHGPRALDLARAAASSAPPGALRVFPLDRTGLGGAAVFGSDEALAEFPPRLEAQGLAMPDGPTWERLRVEIALPRFGVDFSEQNYPQEASIEKRAVSFSKGCYLGQETVFMLHARGHVKKKLVQLRIEGEDEPAAGALVTDAPAEKELGSVTSLAPALEGGAWLALAYVKYRQAKHGAELRVAGRRAEVIGLTE